MSCALDNTKQLARKSNIINGVDELVNDSPEVISKFGRFHKYIKDLAISKFGELPEGAAKPMELEGKKVVFNTPFFDWVDTKNSALAIEDTVPEEVAEETVDKVKLLLDRLGIEVKLDLDKPGAVGMAVILDKLIKVVRGELGQHALPEEAMHFVEQVIKQKYPELHKEMSDNINKYKIYSETLNTYGDHPDYRLPNGAKNLPKLRSEAIAKLLTGLIVNEDLTDSSKLVDTGMTWWSRIFDFLKKLFSKVTHSPLEEDPFVKAASRVFDEDFILPADIQNLTQAMTFLQLGTPNLEKQKTLFDKLTNDMKSGKYKKIENKDERYYDIEGKKYFMSVTDVVKSKMEKEHRFTERSESEKFRDTFNRDWGVAVDETLTGIMERYIDPETGLMRAKPLERPKKVDGTFDLSATPIGKLEMSLRKFKAPTVGKMMMYDTLEAFAQEFLKTFPAGTRFKWQVIIADTNAKRVVPGTVDFMAILPDVSVKIYDWKSVESEFFSIALNKKQQKEDLAWFKKKQYNIQLGEYKKMFTNSGSVYARALDTKVEGRNPIRFSIDVTESRAIPIAASFLRKKADITKASWVDNTIYDLDNITIGTPDWSDPWRMLKPVPTTDEKTYIDELDTLINKIDKIYNDLFSKRYSTKKDREAKARELNRLQEAKRDIQVNHHIGSTLNTLILTLNRLNRELPNSDFILIRRNLGTLKALDNLKKSLEGIFSTLAADKRRVESAIKTTSDPIKKKALEKELELILKNEELQDRLGDVDTNINLLSEKYRERNKSNIRILAEKLGISNIFAIQRQISLLSLERLFNGKSESYIKTVQVFNKLLHEAHNSSKFEFKDVRDKLVKSRKDLQAWAKDHKMSLQEALNLMLTKDTVAGENLKFVAKWKKDFYKGRDIAIANLKRDDATIATSIEWFVANTEFDKAGYEEELKEKKEQIAQEEFDVDPKINEEARKAALDDYINRHNPYPEKSLNREAFNKNNKFLQPKDFWKTDEYNFLEKNKPLWEAYQLFREIVKDAERSGIVERWLYTRSIPNMENMMMLGTEELPGKMAVGMINSLYEEDVPMYKLDELGYPEFHIHARFTKDLGVWRERAVVEDGKKKVQKYKDYSAVSKDLFSVFLNFAESAITTKNLQNIEDASLLLLDYEYSKEETIPTTIFGNTIENPIEGKLRKEKIRPEDNKNAAFLQKFIMNDLYHNKGEEDTALSKYSPTKFIERQIRKTKGGEEFLERLKEHSKFLSLRSLILAINAFNQLRILGFNFRAAAANYVVGMSNVWFESGKKYNMNDTLPPTSVEELTKFFAAVEYFLPGIEFKYSTRSRNGAPQVMGTFNEIRKEYGVLNAVAKSDIQRMLYSLMRETDKAVQYHVFIAMLRNATVVGGKITPISEHVKNTIEFEVGGKKVKYADRFNLPESERDELLRKVDEKIQEVKSKSSLLELASIKDDGENAVMSLDGIERNSSTVSNFRTKVQESIKDVLGSITEEDQSSIRMHWMGTILLTFKNWMPRQVRVRFGKFQRNSNKDAYDIGKHRILAKHYTNNIQNADGTFNWGVIPGFITELLGTNRYLQQMGIIQKYGYDHAVSLAYNQYADELLKRGDVETRQEADLEMPTLSEFTDLYEQKLSASFRELRTLLLFTVMLFAYNKLNDPADESWWEIFIISSIKRTLYDVGFWGPNFWYSLAKKPLAFLGLFDDIIKLLKHSATYAAVGGQHEATMTKKYVMKVAPITREYVNLRSMFDDEFRKKYDIQLKSYSW